MSRNSEILGAVVVTADGSLTLSHPEHGECYHSHAGAGAEARDLYVKASGIEECWDAWPEIAVLDVGMGLGYNAVATIAAWMRADHPSDLVLHSLEINEQLVEALSSGTAPWQANWEAAELKIARALRRSEDGGWSAQIAHPHASVQCRWRVVIGDATTLAFSDVVRFHYVWQDPFSPARNPALWTESWFAALRAVAHPACRLMTYSVARAVRDALTAAGWAYEKIPSPLKAKRHWLRATPETLA